jgi:hypothetical protein
MKKESRRSQSWVSIGKLFDFYNSYHSNSINDRGGWVVTNILASELSNQFVCGVLPHPSINLEERVYGGNLLELMSRVNRPILLMPAKVSLTFIFA